MDSSELPYSCLIWILTQGINLLDDLNNSPLG